MEKKQNKHLVVLVQHTKTARSPIGSTTNGRPTIALVVAHNSPRPQKNKALEVEESEEIPKRPKMDFGHRRVAGPLRITKGRMGQASSDEESL